MDWGLVAWAADGSGFEFVSVLKTWVAEFGRKWVDFITWFESMRKTIEPVTWVIGSVLALVPGSFALYKWVYYRYSRLPERLDDMLEKEEHRLRQARDHLLAALERPAPVKKFAAPIFVVGSLSKAMRALKWAQWRNGKTLVAADDNLQTALTEIDTQLEYWEKKHANYQRQKATAYLLRGAIASAHGTKKRVNGADSIEHNRLALGYFQQALEIDPTDHQALEYTAHQQRMLGMLDEALQSYKRLLDLVDKPEPEFALIRMRARRYCGEILWAKYVETEVALRLTEAKKFLEDALEDMPTAARSDLDHAYVLRYLAAVEWKRSTQRWTIHLPVAENIFLSLIYRKKSVKEAEAGLTDIRQLKCEITAPDGDGVAHQAPAQDPPATTLGSDLTH